MDDSSSAGASYGPRSPRAPKPLAPGSCADRFPELRVLRGNLDVLRVHHMELTRRFLAAADGNLFLPDMFLTALMQRSYGLVDAMIEMVDNYNLVAAAPLLRLQLDSLVRASYVAHAPDADVVVMDVLNGVEFRAMRDKDGCKLTDRRLNELAAPYHPWVAAVYEKTSGWVHLSSVHMFSTWRTGGGAEESSSGTFRAALPLPPDWAPARLWAELLDAMAQATREIFGYVESWESRKGLPPGEVRPWADRSADED